MFGPHVCNKCHDLLTMAYGLENIAILSKKGATFRCILRGISRNEGLRRLNNSGKEWNLVQIRRLFIWDRVIGGKKLFGDLRENWLR